MSNQIETVGMIGFGSMGQFVAENMLPDTEVVVHDKEFVGDNINGVIVGSFDEVAECDAIILAVPASSLVGAVGRLANARPPKKEQLLVDISSVKMFPEKVIDELWHGESLLTHPLFGPQSAKSGLNDHRLIVTSTEGRKADELLGIWRGLGIKQISMTAEDHDREMAMIQALPFALGRLASEVDEGSSLELQTPSRLSVRKLMALDTAQSDELFETMLCFNPFADKVVRGLRRAISNIPESTMNYSITAEA